MTRTLEIEISEELLQRLSERAQQLQVSPSQLAAMKLNESLESLEPLEPLEPLESLAPLEPLTPMQTWTPMETLAPAVESEISNEEFRAIVDHILEKDAELLRRLA